MKKVLLLGGSHRDIPLIQAAKELGYFVITLANKSEYIGHSYADKFYMIDFKNLEAVEQIIKEENIRDILPGCGESSYMSTVLLANKLNIGNFDSPHVAQLVHNKWKFKEFCLANDISTPKGFFYNSTHTLPNIDYPVMIKPTQLSGGNGVAVVNNAEELTNSLLKTKKISDEVFIEDHIEGELIAYSIFLQNQKIIYSFSGKDENGINPYLITTAYPISLQKDVEKRIVLDIEKIAKKLHLVDGMFHLQIIIKDKTPYIIDVTRRIPGDLYPMLIEYCDKVEYSKAVVKAYLGEALNHEFVHKQETREFFIRYVVMPRENGIFKELHINEKLQNNIFYRLNLLKPNKPINDYLHTQIEIVFLQSISNQILPKLPTLIYPRLRSKYDE